VIYSAYIRLGKYNINWKYFVKDVISKIFRRCFTIFWVAICEKNNSLPFKKTVNRYFKIRDSPIDFKFVCLSRQTTVLIVFVLLFSF
jgi:hypothetical protein